jgi:hypothetical protein
MWWKVERCGNNGGRWVTNEALPKYELLSRYGVLCEMPCALSGGCSFGFVNMVERNEYRGYFDLYRDFDFLTLTI